MGSEKLVDIRNQARDTLAEAEWSAGMESHERARVSRYGQRLGAIKAISALGKHFSSTAFREFQRYVEDNDGEAWKALGYQTVVEFLNSPDSEMTKHEYYNRREAITREGDAAFDLLNALDISFRGRKLLGDGEIRVEETEVYVGDNRVPIADRAAVRSLIATLVESRSTAQDTIEKQSRVIERGKKDVEKYKRQADEARRTAGAASGTPHAQALLTLVGAYAHLREEIAAYRDVVQPETDEEQEFQKFWRTVIDTIGQCYMDLSEAAGVAARAGDDAGSGDDLTEMLGD